MEDFGHEVTFGRVVGEIVLDGEFAAEQAAFVGCADWAFDVGLDVGQVCLIEDDFDACE